MRAGVSCDIGLVPRSRKNASPAVSGGAAVENNMRKADFRYWKGKNMQDAPWTELQKMTAGELYDPSDPELVKIRVAARKLCRRYNSIDEDEPERQTELLRKLLTNSDHIPAMQAPIYFEYGCNTYFGDRCFTNFSFTCMDICPIYIGDDVMMGPNVTLATPMHPFLPEERNMFVREDGTLANLEYGKPIRIEKNCWLAANVVVCGGVTIGEGAVIGAGSVVTRDVPPYVLAAGNPCRVIRDITEEDRMRRN